MRDLRPWLITVAYAAIFTWLGAVKYAAHRNLVDFGIFAQTVASAFGCFCNTVEGSHWAFHFSPILYVAGAVLAVVHSPLTLAAIQALACALSIPPVYALVVKGADRTTALLAAIVVALYPPLAGLTFNDFHENGFAPAAVAWMLWAFDAGKLGLTVAFAVATLAVKEDQAAFLAIAGAFGGWFYRGTRAGRVALVVAGMGVIVTVLFFFIIQPHAAANPQWAPQRFYAWSADDVRAFVPRGILERVGFFVLAFLPLLFLPLRSRMTWLAAAPLGEVLLSRMSTTYTMGSHYAGAWLGYVAVAFAFAVRDLPARRARTMLAWCIGLCVLEFAVANPLHPGLNLHKSAARDAALDRALAALPPRASIATQEEAFTHLALDDPRAALLPEVPERETRECYALVDRDFPDSPRLQEYGDALRRLVDRGTYRLVRREGGIELYQRGDCR